MTVLCAAVVRTGCWIGSDTMVTAGHLREFCGPKWIRKNDWLIGVAGQARVLTLLRSAPHSLLITPENVADWLRDTIRKDGWKIDPEKFGEAPEVHPLETIAVRHGEAWSICNRFSVIPITEYQAVGSGGELAHGAWTALRSKAVKHRFRESLHVAMELCIHCGGAPYIEFLPKD